MKVSGHMEAVFNAILDAGIREGELEDEIREDVMLLLIGLLRSIQVLLVLKMPHRTVTPESIAKAIDLVFDGARSSLVKSGELKRGIRQ
jgi:hypothetical protein